MTVNRSLLKAQAHKLTAIFCGLILFFGLNSALLLGAPVGRDRALGAAQRWRGLTQNPMGRHAGTVGKITTYSNTAGEARFHVVDLEPSGFVVISCDDELEPVVAFSPTGKFAGQTGNPLFDFLQKDMDERVRHSPSASKGRGLPLSKSKENGKWERLTPRAAPAATGEPPTASSSEVSAVDDICVAPFVLSKWNQSTVYNGSSYVAVYNYYTPPSAAGDANNYVAGCTATAWAQIMRFHQWPATGVGTVSYSITVNGSTQQRALRGGNGLGGPYDWANMVLAPGSGITLQQRQAIGALLADAGVANNMSYTEGASGAYLRTSAIKSVFQYANAAYSSSSLANNLVAIRANLDAGLPVALAIYDTTSGHQVVCDGYGYNNSTLYHHLNMGWGGYEDLWYNLPTVSAGGYAFDTVAGISYNIDPTVSGEIISGRITDFDGSPISGVTVTLSGPFSRTAKTNARGIYAFKGLTSNASWTVTAAAEGFLFSPTQASLTTGSSYDYSTPGDRVADFMPRSPTVTTGTATNITKTSAILFGQINPNGISSAVQFEYGLTTAYGSTASVTLSSSNGLTIQNLSGAIAGLQMGSLYHYRITANSAFGTVVGQDETFQTTGSPVVITGAMGKVTTTSATLNGSVNPNGYTTTAQFEYGLTAAYGTKMPVTLSPANGQTPQTVSVTLSGLQTGATYHYRLSATSCEGAGASPDTTFQTSNQVSTLAGTAGVSGSTDGVGTAAKLGYSNGLAVDGAGNVYVSDYVKHTIRKITPAGVVTTFAGLAGTSGSTDSYGSAARFNTPMGMATDATGNLYVADYGNHTIRRITPAGIVSTLAGKAGTSGSADGVGTTARFSSPSGVAVDGSYNIYVAEYGNNTIRKVTLAGVVTTLAGTAGTSGTADGTGKLALFDSPKSVTVGANNNLYVADYGNHTIRKVTSAGVVTTLAGMPDASGSTDGTGTTARFLYPKGVAVDKCGNIYVSDSNQAIRKVTPKGGVTTLAGSAGISGSADGTGTTARFNGPCAVAIDASGNVYVADTDNFTVRKIAQYVDPTPAVTLAGFNPLTFEASNSYTDAGAAAQDAGGNALTPSLVAQNVASKKPGVYTVQWAATDSLGRSGTVSRIVNVVDTTPPAITVPSDMTLIATTSGGALGGFMTSATDLVSGQITTTDTPSAGTVFTIGTTAVSTTATDAAGNSSVKTFNITVTTPTRIWQAQHFTAAELADPGIASLTAAPGGDGVPNLLKYAFGLDPRLPASRGKMPGTTTAKVSNATYPAIRFRQLSSALTDLQYCVLESTDLVNWTEVDPVACRVGQPVDNGDGTQTVTVHGTIPLDGPSAQPKAFLKVKVQDLTVEPVP